MKPSCSLGNTRLCAWRTLTTEALPGLMIQGFLFRVNPTEGRARVTVLLPIWASKQRAHCFLQLCKPLLQLNPKPAAAAYHLQNRIQPGAAT